MDDDTEASQTDEGDWRERCPVHQCTHHLVCYLTWCPWRFQYDCRGHPAFLAIFCEQHVLDSHTLEHLALEQEWLDYQLEQRRHLEPWQDGQAAFLAGIWRRQTQLSALAERMTAELL